MSEDALPPVFRAWADAALGTAVPVERTATCGECVMCPSGGDGLLLGSPAFSPDLKCSTYVPELPSFLVGAVLSDDDPSLEAGRVSIGARIDAGVGVTPFGLKQPPGYRASAAERAPGMGRDPGQLCPHYVSESGTCGIWKYREAVCATWFCRHDHGQAGAATWNALTQFLQRLQAKLVLWCAEKLELGLPGLTALVTDSDESGFGWGPWAGRERDYYVACHEWVAGLTPEQALEIGGLEVDVLARLVRQTLAVQESELVPDRLTVGRHQVIGVSAEGSTVVTYSPFNPITLPAALLGVLHYFDGRLTHEVLTQLVEERGVGLDPVYLKQLVDYGVLVGVVGPPPTPE